MTWWYYGSMAYALAGCLIFAGFLRSDNVRRVGDLPLAEWLIVSVASVFWPIVVIAAFVICCIDAVKEYKRETARNKSF